MSEPVGSFPSQYLPVQPTLAIASFRQRSRLSAFDPPAASRQSPFSTCARHHRRRRPDPGSRHHLLLRQPIPQSPLPGPLEPGPISQPLQEISPAKNGRRMEGRRPRPGTLIGDAAQRGRCHTTRSGSTGIGPRVAADGPGDRHRTRCSDEVLQLAEYVGNCGPGAHNCRSRANIGMSGRAGREVGQSDARWIFARRAVAGCLDYQEPSVTVHGSVLAGRPS
jgi:hypothetical protein